MKKLFFAIYLLLLSVTIGKAQTKSNFEGVIVYDMSFDASELSPEVLNMLKGSKVTTYVKGDKRRVDTTTPMSSQSVITDEKNKKVVSLMEALGQKYLITMSETDVKKETENTPVPTIKYLEETKIIAGYKCKKAELIIKSKDGKEEILTIFYTDELPTSSFRPVYKGLKGLPMEYTMNQTEIKIILTASNVSKEKVSDSIFEVPAGYKETTLEELQLELMKLNGQ